MTEAASRTMEGHRVAVTERAMQRERERRVNSKHHFSAQYFVLLAVC